MFNWISKVFGDKVDPIVLALTKDQELLDKVEILNNSTDNFENNKELQFIALSICQEIAGILKNIKIHNKIDDTRQIQPFIDVVPKLTLYFLIDQEIPQTQIIIMKCLIILYIISDTFPSENLIPKYITKLCKLYPIFIQESLNFEHTIRLFLTNQSIVQQICSTSFMKFFINDLLTLDDTMYNTLWFTKCLHKYSNNIKLIYFEKQSFLLEFFAAIADDKIIEAQISSFTSYFCFLLRLGSNFDPTTLNLFLELDGLTKLINYLLKRRPVIITWCFIKISSTNFPQFNQIVYDFMLNEIKNKHDNFLAGTMLLGVFSNLLESYPGPPKDLEKNFTFLELFQPYLTNNVSGILIGINYFNALASRNYPGMGRAITFIFSGITAYTIDMGTLTDFFKHVQHLIENKLLRLEDVGNAGFIDYCFFIGETKQFTELLMKPTFLSILSSIIRLYDFGIHWKIFRIVLSKEHDLPQLDFTDICLKLFQGEDVKVLMNPLLKYIGQNTSEALISILMSSFMQNENSVSIFVQENGMEWISQLMEKKFFNPSSFTIFLSSMLHMSFVPEISLWINSQPLDSMIFSLSEEMIFHLVYGPNVIYQLHIHIPSLLPLLNVNNMELSPYSQYISSKYGFSEFIRHKSPIDDNHIIKDLANRYIIPYQFCFLLKNSKKLVEFADKSYDHFNMFQFNKNTVDPYFVIPENCKAMSFWIKTEHINEKSIKIMSCSALTLSVNSNEATFNFLDQDYSVPFKENEWTFIVIAITVINNRKVMYLTCGSKTYDIKFSQNIDQISEIVMGSKQSLSTIWYLGSSIRLFSQFHPSILSLKYNGPSLMRISKIPTETLVITPFSSIKQIGKGSVLVPYNGFPSFIKRKRHFIELIAEILISEDKDRINDIYETLLNCFEIFQGKVMDFWVNILRVIKEKHEFISNENISSTISIFIQYATQGMIEYHIQPLIYDINMWTLYHDELYAQIMKTMNKNNVSSKIFQSNFVKTIISLCSLEKNAEKQEHYLDIFFTRLELEPSVELFYHLYYLIISYSSSPLIIPIISHFKNMMKNINCELVSVVFNFDSCSSLLSVLDTSMQIEIMKIMTYLASISSNYYKNNEIFLFYILSLSNKKFTWITSLCLIFGEKYQENLTVSHFSTKKVKYQEAIKLIVSLTLMSIFFHQLSPCFPPESIKPEFISLNEITTDVEKFMIKLLETNPDLFKTDDLYQTILFLLPTLFSPGIVNYVDVTEPYEMESLPLFQTKYYMTFSRIWDISQHFMESIILPNETSFYQSSVAPFMSMYANIGSSLFENFSYDNKGLLPSYHNNPNYDKIYEFLGSYILIFQNQPDKFKEIMDCLIVESEYKMYYLTIDIVSYILMNIHKCDINMTSLRYVILFTTSIISNILYNFARFPLYIGFMMMIYNISGLTITDPKILSDIRFCFAIILNFITSSELSQLATQINRIPNYFSKVRPFLSDLNLVLFATLKFISAVQDKSCDSDKFIIDFFKIIAIPQTISNNQNSNNLIDALTIQKFMVGIKLLTTSGTASFNRWCVDNSEVFNNSKKIMVESCNEFLSIPNSVIEYVPLDKFNQNISNFTKFLTEKLSEIRITFSATFYYLSTFIQCTIQNNMRCIERDFYSAWINFQIGCLSSPVYSKQNSLMITSLTWPMSTPRVITPSPSTLPDVKFGVSISENDFDFEIQKPKFSLHFDTLNYSYLIPVNKVNFDSSIKNIITPTSFSEVILTSQVSLFDTFENVFGEQQEFVCVFSCSFMRFSQILPCSIFCTKEKFFVIINSSVNNNNLELITDIQSPILFRTISDPINIGLFGKTSLFCGHFVIEIEFENVMGSFIHMWNHLPKALVITSFKCTEFILIANDTFPQFFTKELQNRSTTFSQNLPDKPLTFFNQTLDNATNLWSNGHLTSHDYLLFLNSLGGRSFSDLAQYPVFPWIISDYLNKKSPREFRDLTKPMGMQTLERAQYFESIYKDSNGQYFYGQHYSMSASIHFYLARLPPYSLCEWDLHGGWDHEHRIFQDINGTWQSCSRTNNADVKELIPEFFDIPETFLNPNKFNPEKGDKFNVELPVWAQSAAHFVNANRFFLEQAQDMNKWIDLIFGSSQMGQSAIQSKNVFLPISYQIPPSPDENLDTLTLQLQNWGQCPLVLFKKPHPIRENSVIKSTTSLFCDLDNIQLVQTNYRYNPLNVDFLLSDGIHSLQINPSQLNFIYKTNGKKTFFKDSSIVFANKVSKSSNNCFIVVDLSVSVSIAFRLYFKGTQLSEIRSISSFSNDNPPISTAVNGNDFVACSLFERHVLTWDILRATIQKRIDFDEKLIDCGFDDYNGFLYVLSISTLFVYTVNGLLISKNQLMRKATSLLVLDLDRCDQIRPVVVGYDDGSIDAFYLNAEYNRIERIFERSISNFPIVHLVMDSSKQAIYAYDAKDSSFTIYNTMKYALNTRANSFD